MSLCANVKFVRMPIREDQRNWKAFFFSKHFHGLLFVENSTKYVRNMLKMDVFTVDVSSKQPEKSSYTVLCHTNKAYRLFFGQNKR